jgi:SagB-type dehydrogenase family enzyme
MSGFLSAADMLAGGPEGADSLSELYHENSKQRRSDRGFIERIIATSASPVLYRMMYSSYKRYRPAARTELPEPAETGELAGLIARRRSRRDFATRPLALESVSALLRFSVGETAAADEGVGRPRPFRAAPSAGALYPLEAYLVAARVDGLATGVHRYDPAAHALEHIDFQPRLDALARATAMDELGAAAGMMVVTAIPARSRLKYGERAYRFVLLEAGHVAQNMLLVAEQLGLSACAVGGFVDAEVDTAIGIDGVDEISLYVVALGHPTPPELIVVPPEPHSPAAGQ